jgi:tetratricopeptide (TPR) repeat protein
MQDKKIVFEKYNNLLNEQKYKEASSLLKGYLEQFNKKDEGIFRIYLLLGWLYDQWALKIKEKLLRNQYQNEAKKYFRKSIKNGKFKQEAFRGIGTVLMHQEKISQALEYYKKAHSLKKDFSTYNDLGNIYRRLNKDKLAISFYKKAFFLNKNKEKSAIPLFNLIIVNRKLNNQKEGKKYLKILKKLAKKSKLAETTLSRLSNLESKNH